MICMRWNHETTGIPHHFLCSTPEKYCTNFTLFGQTSLFSPFSVGLPCWFKESFCLDLYSIKFGCSFGGERTDVSFCTQLTWVAFATYCYLIESIVKWVGLCRGGRPAWNKVEGQKRHPLADLQHLLSKSGSRRHLEEIWSNSVVAAGLVGPEHLWAMWSSFKSVAALCQVNTFLGER